MAWYASRIASHAGYTLADLMTFTDQGPVLSLGVYNVCGHHHLRVVIVVFIGRVDDAIRDHNGVYICFHTLQEILHRTMRQ